MLLGRLVDGECGFLSRLLANGLLISKAEARTYCETLRLMSGKLNAELKQSDHELKDLWRGISARIDAEERAAIFLGKRPQPLQSTGSILDRLFGWRALLGSGAVAATATAAVILSLMPVGREVMPGVLASSDRPMTNGAIVPVSQTSRQSRENFERPRLVEDRYVDAMEVDWVRGRGRVRVMQSPEDRSAILWVRRPQGSGLRVIPSPLAAAGLGSGAPTVGAFGAQNSYSDRP